MAIFVGCGKDGWRSVVRGGKPSAEVERMLSKEFVCFYLDADTSAGKSLASALKLSDDMGLVLGDRTGEYIDHRHVGAMSESDLSECLGRCCGTTMNGSMSGSMGAAMQALGFCASSRMRIRGSRF